ncbi:MAG: NHLP-related RiPP peptide [Burkholderiaceae bacterium]|nr:NHLP-related RiPP peptide [Burkholderiaceae bacterium]
MANFNPGDLDTLLDKLSSDDAFREQMLGNPAQALAGIGLNIDPAQIPAIRTLPSKDALAADRATIQAKLDSAAGALPFFLSGTL